MADAMSAGILEGSQPQFVQGREYAAVRVEAMVASAFALTPGAIRGPQRGRATAAFARQVAMYLTHTRLGLSFTEAGAYFGRDRTTAAHACRRIEDKREDPAVDAILDVLERAIDVCPDMNGASA
jgi:chromosomal replication initiation ATPase DnaA